MDMNFRVSCLKYPSSTVTLAERCARSKAAL